MKRFVWKDWLKNEKGFSFITMIFALTIISMTLPIVAYLLQTTSHLSSNYNELSTQQFFQFIRDEIINANDIKIEGNKLKLTQLDSEIIIEQYGALIRRQVDRKGHEILLQDIDQFSIESNPYGIRIKIRNTLGDTYEKVIVFYQIPKWVYATLCTICDKHSFHTDYI
ncbi:competence type IV pilus minor pilin ComGF [Oceanobacillus sp. Castelsardo]|uniref:competence type IV pilus minor pilin ComGF n=1 Tax=Oceanobacillus sp. Castelsardo TaxID=1851204 RepID=UPI0008382EA4|nr:competence type IV pilus minor pilin ComGF [Oceanobacillus sp. Castelsardo]